MQVFNKKTKTGIWKLSWIVIMAIAGVMVIPGKVRVITILGDFVYLIRSHLSGTISWLKHQQTYDWKIEEANCADRRR